MQIQLVKLPLWRGIGATKRVLPLWHFSCLWVLQCSCGLDEIDKPVLYVLHKWNLARQQQDSANLVPSSRHINQQPTWTTWQPFCTKPMTFAWSRLQSELQVSNRRVHAHSVQNLQRACPKSIWFSQNWALRPIKHKGLYFFVLNFYWEPNWFGTGPLYRYIKSEFFNEPKNEFGPTVPQ